MADRQIGIRLDVKQTGLQQVGDSLDDISKNLSDMEEATTNKRQKLGWGSEAQTKELKEQLRYMEQLARLHERIARTQGKSLASPDSSSSGLPPRSTRHGESGGSLAQRGFGKEIGSSIDKMTSMITKLGAVMVGFSVGSTIMSGLGRGDQLAFGYGDILKRMGGSPSGGMSYARDTARALQGYGYDDLAVQSATGAYTNATGRMNPNTLQEQMKAILATGRRFGWSDPNQSAGVFADAFSSGITGGSEAQMNPQQFAALVANATVSAHMQGREMTMLQQMQQVTQMQIQSMGTAGDARTTAAFLALGNQTGNQALIGQLPGMIGNINSGIMNPSGGYNAQALMMRAVGGGQMGYWQTMYQQSLGAFGENPTNGKTNIENVTDYMLGAFQGDEYRQYAMLGQMFNMTPAQAKLFIDNYTKGGKFKSDALNQLRNETSQNPINVPDMDTDKLRQGFVDKQTGADLGGTYTTPLRSEAGRILGDTLGSEAGGYAQLGAGAIGGATSLGGGFLLSKLFGKLFKTGSKVVGTGASTGTAAAEAAASAEAGTLSRTATYGARGLAMGGLMRLLGLAGAMYTTQEVMDQSGASDAIRGAGKNALDVIVDPDKFRTPEGTEKGYSAWNYFGKTGFFSRIFGGYKGANEQSSNPTTGSSSSASTYAPPMALQSYNSGVGTTASGQELAPIVVSILMALQPYMGQIKGILGSGASNAIATPNANMPFSTMSMRSSMPAPNSSGIVLAAVGGNAKRVIPSSSGSSAMSSSSMSSTAFTGDRSEFIQQMLPYAQQASQATGLPVDYILAQWAHESGWGTSSAAKKNNNFAGIKPWKTGNYGASAGTNGTYAGYSSLSDFASGYSDFYLHNSRYKDMLEAARNGATGDELAQMIGKTGYAEDSDYTDKMRKMVSGVDKTLQGMIKIQDGSININITNEPVQTVKMPIKAEFTGLKLA